MPSPYSCLDAVSPRALDLSNIEIWVVPQMNHAFSCWSALELSCICCLHILIWASTFRALPFSWKIPSLWSNNHLQPDQAFLGIPPKFGHSFLYSHFYGLLHVLPLAKEHFKSLSVHLLSHLIKGLINHLSLVLRSKWVNVSATLRKEHLTQN